MDIMLISPNTIKSLGELSANVDDTYLGAAIRVAQEVYLTDAVGTELVEKLKDLVEKKINGQADGIDATENIAYRTLLDEYIKYVLVYKSLEETALRTALKIRSLNTVRNSDTNSQPAELDDVKYLIDHFRTYFNHWLNRTTEFLCENKEAITEAKVECDKCKQKSKFGNINLYLGN